MQNLIAKINLQSVYDNAKTFKTLTGTELCAVVKANAYGHGMEEVTCALESVVSTFAVATIDEAEKIRVSACGKDILVFTPPKTTEELLRFIFSPFVFTVDDVLTAKKLILLCNRFSKTARVHLKFNSGMNRYGASEEEIKSLCKLFSCSPVVVEGVYSHLYTTDKSVAEEQRQLFLQVEKIVKGYFPNAKAHLSATFGALLGKDFAFDMVRIGLGLYGYLPEGTQDLPTPKLKKAMQVYAKAERVRKYSFGGIGYGNGIDGKLEKIKRSSGVFTVVRCGYADGVFREEKLGYLNDSVSNLCMDVGFLKGNRRGLIPIMTDAEKTARRVGTIPYEILCYITMRADIEYEK